MADENKQGLLSRAADALAALRGDPFTSLNIGIKASTQVRFPGYGSGGHGGGYYEISDNITRAVTGALSRYAGTRVDYASEVGDPLCSSLVAAAVNFVAVTLPEAQLRITEPSTSRMGDDIRTPVKDHALIDLLENPNPYYTSDLMWQSLAATRIVFGNTYWWKVRNGLGEIIQLWPLYPGWVTPRWFTDTSFIDYYEYRVNGAVIELDPHDVWHLRSGLDASGRMGVSPLMSVYREIFGDNEAANMSAVLMKNLGVFPFVVSPKDGVNMAGMTPEDKKALKDEFVRRTTGDERGKPLVNTIGLQIDRVAFTPKEMDITALRRVPEERVAAAIGIPGIVLGFGGAWDKSNYSNYAEAREQAYESYIVPLQRSIAKNLTKHILHDKSAKLDKTGKQEVSFDYSEVRVLQEDRDKLVTRVVAGYQGGVMTLAEAREPLGLKVSDEHDVYYSPKAPDPNRDPNADENQNQDQEGNGQTPGKKDHAHEFKSVEWQGMTLSREPSELEVKIGFKDVADEQDHSKEVIAAILLLLRANLIKEAVKKILKLKPSEYHTLTLEVADESYVAVRAAVESAYIEGRRLVRRELVRQGAPDRIIPSQVVAELDKAATAEINTITEVTVSRVVNQVQASASSSASAGTIVGESGEKLKERVEANLTEASTAPVENAARAAANASINRGRNLEFEAVLDGLDGTPEEEGIYFIYTAIMDSGTCNPCAAADEEHGPTLDDVAPAPNPECLGIDKCRCWIICVFEDNTSRDIRVA